MYYAVSAYYHHIHTNYESERFILSEGRVKSYGSYFYKTKKIILEVRYIATKKIILQTDIFKSQTYYVNKVIRPGKHY